MKSKVTDVLVESVAITNSDPLKIAVSYALIGPGAAKHMTVSYGFGQWPQIIGDASVIKTRELLAEIKRELAAELFDDAPMTTPEREEHVDGPLSKRTALITSDVAMDHLLESEADGDLPEEIN